MTLSLNSPLVGWGLFQSNKTDFMKILAPIALVVALCSILFVRQDLSIRCIERSELDSLKKAVPDTVFIYHSSIDTTL